MHASVVIGRRQNATGQCQFLVRNSWGRNFCNGYSNAAICVKNGQEVTTDAAATRYGCINNVGGSWEKNCEGNGTELVNSDDLSRNTYQVSFFE